MSRFDRLLDYVPRFLSSRTSIVIGAIMFAYLVVLGLLAMVTGHTEWVPDNVQLVLGNYTNVLSMVGAGVAAGASRKAVVTQRHAKQLHAQTHDMLREITEKLDG